MVLPLRVAIHKQSEENELSFPRAPEVKMGSQGLALLPVFWGPPHGAQELSAPSLEGGHWPWTAAAARQAEGHGLPRPEELASPQLCPLLCDPQSRGYPLWATHGLQQHPHLPCCCQGLALRHPADGLSADASMGGRAPAPTCLGVLRGQHDLIRALLMLPWTARVHES